MACPALLTRLVIWVAMLRLGCRVTPRTLIDWTRERPGVRGGSATLLRGFLNMISVVLEGLRLKLFCVAQVLICANSVGMEDELEEGMTR